MDEGLELSRQRAKPVHADLGVEPDALALLEGLEAAFEIAEFQAENNVSKHAQEPAVAVVRESVAPGAGGETQHAVVVEAEVEHGVHHAGHGNPRARPDGNKQGVLRIAELRLHHPFQAGQALDDFLPQAFGISPIPLEITDAGLRADGETGRNRQAQARHLRQVGPFAAQEVFHVGPAVKPFSEGIGVLDHLARLPFQLSSPDRFFGRRFVRVRPRSGSSQSITTVRFPGPCVLHRSARSQRPADATKGEGVKK